MPQYQPIFYIYQVGISDINFKVRYFLFSVFRLKKLRPNAAMTFNYIRNQIRQYSKDALIDRCYLEIEGYKDRPIATWQIFTMLKWTFLYAGTNYPSKPLNEKAFAKIYKATYMLDEGYLGFFAKQGDFKRYFQILHSQQFYLHRKVIKETFASQLKIYTKLSHQFDIDKLFQTKTGLTIEEMLCLLQTLWIIIFHANSLSSTVKYRGLIERDHLEALTVLSGQEKMEKFINLLLIDPSNAEEKIKNAPYSLNKEELQSFERTFFTIYPLQVYKGRYIKVVHPDVIAHTMNHYIYDFLKREPLFPEEFGYRIEKYVALGLREIKANYVSEVDLKKRLGENSKVVDFALENDKILIECKSIELSPSVSIVPTADSLYSGLKGSILKAYTQQMLTVASQFNSTNTEPYFGIILTYKEMYWSKFVDLYEVVKNKLPTSLNTAIMPPSNVFIIDLLTWDKMVQIIKDKKATLRQILEKAILNNTNPKTAKMLFNMHLEEYDLKRFNLNYLTDELKHLDAYYKK